MNWRPIETAPKDGTRLLLCNASHDSVEVGFWDKGFYWTSRNGFDGEWTNGYCDEYERDVVLKPTHWMPLPEPPKGE